MVKGKPTPNKRKNIGKAKTGRKTQQKPKKTPAGKKPVKKAIKLTNNRGKGSKTTKSKTGARKKPVQKNTRKSKVVGKVGNKTTSKASNKGKGRVTGKGKTVTNRKKTKAPIRKPLTRKQSLAKRRKERYPTALGKIRPSIVKGDCKRLLNRGVTARQLKETEGDKKKRHKINKQLLYNESLTTTAIAHTLSTLKNIKEFNDAWKSIPDKGRRKEVFQMMSASNYEVMNYFHKNVGVNV